MNIPNEEKYNSLGNNFLKNNDSFYRFGDELPVNMSPVKSNISTIVSRNILIEKTREIRKSYRKRTILLIRVLNAEIKLISAS